MGRLHKYVRRIIRWAATPSDEDRNAESRERWLHRLAWSVNSPPDRRWYTGRSLQSLAETKAAFIELDSRSPGSCLYLRDHLAFIEYMHQNDGRLPAPQEKMSAVA